LFNKNKKNDISARFGQTQKKFGLAHHGQTRSETDLPLPSLGKQEVKWIRPCPSWGNKK